MALVNEHFLKLPGSYLFSDIAKKVNTFKITHPKRDIIRLGIGDVTRPLPKACIEAMHKAVEEMTSAETFRGYGPEQGYDFLIEAIIKNDYAPRGIHLSPTFIWSTLTVTSCADEPEYWTPKAESGATSLICPALPKIILFRPFRRSVSTLYTSATPTTRPVRR